LHELAYDPAAAGGAASKNPTQINLGVEKAHAKMGPCSWLANSPTTNK
jgi:hypothetical protein